MRLPEAMKSLGWELRYASRALRRTPLFTVAAILAVALGVGPSTAVFSVVDRILFRSLPYAHDERLVSFGMTMASVSPQEFMAGYDYLDWREANTPFEALGAWSGMGKCDLTGHDPVRVGCASIDAHLLPALGIQPLLGRNFTPGQDQPRGPRVALISYGLWRSRFNGDVRVVGKTLPLDGEAATIVGVLPPEFELPTLERPEVLAPLALDREEQRTRKTFIMLQAVGRLRPGVTPVQARAQLGPLFQRALNLGVSPAFHKEIQLRVRPLRDRQVMEARLASWILLAAVLAVLAIACANVANLMLARALARHRESALRAALGAGRGRLAAQALIESALVGIMGGAVGILIAAWLLSLFVAIAPEGIPRLGQATLDVRVLLFTLSLSLGSSVVFGLVPALQTPRTETLAGWRTLGGRQPRFRAFLVASQIALSVVLLAGAGLLLHSLWDLQNQPLGLQPEGALTAAISLPQKTYAAPAARLAFFEELERRLARIPGVTEVALCNRPPITPESREWMIYTGIDVAGQPGYEGGTGGTVTLRMVTPRYFAALGIPVLRGRAFEEADRDPDGAAVIVSDRLARALFPGKEPLGQKLRVFGRPWMTVVGVAANVKNNGLAESDAPELYQVRKHSAEGIDRSAIALVRTALDHGLIARQVRRQVAALDPTLPVEVANLQQRVERLAQRPRFNAVLLGIFAGLGLALAAIGLYGLISFLVARRTQEIGVRIALGASRGEIFALVLKQAAGWVAAGAAAGLAGAFFSTRFIETLLFGVSGKDPWTLAGAMGVLFAVALVAAWLPARHAAAVDPVEALRQE